MTFSRIALRRAIRVVLLAVLALVLLAIVLMWIAEYRPQRIETLHNEGRFTVSLPDTISVTTWNIGYAGMDRDADFFIDGGSMVRRSLEQTTANFDSIKGAIAGFRCSFLLLQEVDRYAKRSYHTDQYKQIQQLLPRHTGYFASNFKVMYIPIPLSDPIGRVHAGIASWGEALPYLVERYAYPGAEAFPERTMQLKRCFMVQHYCLPSGNDLVLINTHNSAFGEGSRRVAEMEYLRQLMLAEYQAGNCVVAAGDWNQNPPGYTGQASTPEFAPVRIDSNYLPAGWQYAYDHSSPSMRFANIPYKAGVTLTSTVDFFIVSPNVEVASIHCHAMGFAYSDHNPVTARLVLKQINGK